MEESESCSREGKLIIKGDHFVLDHLSESIIHLRKLVTVVFQEHTLNANWHIAREAKVFNGLILVFKARYSFMGS